MSKNCIIKGKPSSLTFVLVFLGSACVAFVIWWLENVSGLYANSLLASVVLLLLSAFLVSHRESCLNLLERRIDRCFFGVVVKKYPLSSFSKIISELKCIGETDRDFRIDIYFVSNDQRLPDFMFASYWFSAKTLDEAMSFPPALEMASSLSKLTGIAIKSKGPGSD